MSSTFHISILITAMTVGILCLIRFHGYIPSPTGKVTDMTGMEPHGPPTEPRMDNETKGYRQLVDSLYEVQPWKPFSMETEVVADDYEAAYHKLMNKMDLICNSVSRMGSKNDGGWDICVVQPFVPNTNSCLVYSFGIRNDFSFDDRISRTFSCTLRAFDPTMPAEEGEYARDHLITFYSIGLAGHDGPLRIRNRDYSANTLDTLRKRFKEESVILDYLKMDIENSEWAALDVMIEDGTLERFVKQLGIEFHYHDHKYKEYLELEMRLEALGFRKWRNHWNISCRYASDIHPNRWLSHCHEVYYLNMRFLPGYKI